VSLDVLSLDERGPEWDALLASLPARERDLFFGSPWLLLWQERGDGRAMGAVYRDEGGMVLYPFLLRELTALPYLGDEFAGRFDVTSPYGYGGPLVTKGAPEGTVACFREGFAAWCRTAGVVSEFVRFHPLLDTRLPFAPFMDVGEAGQIVWCRFDQGACRVGDQLSATARRNVRAAREAGLTSTIERSPDAYDRFADLYADNAARRRAAPFYRFDRSHVQRLRERLGQAQALVGVRREGELVAGALFLRSDDYVHFHLLAADRTCAGLRPANLVFFEALQWARALGVTAVDLGGGYRGDDELLRFKTGFAGMRAPRFVGRVIHDSPTYIAASRLRDEQGEILDCDYFPAYCSPLPEHGLLG
jgi:hypothetical protein